MDISQAVQQFFVWHTTYSSDPDAHCPSREWLQYVTQELLLRMLPYASVSVREDITCAQLAAHDEAQYQQLELAAVFELVRHMIFDLLHRLSSFLYQNVLGHAAANPDVALAAMNGEELEHYGAHCDVLFHSIAQIEFTVSRAQENSHQAAAMTRQLVFLLQQEVPAHAQYRVSSDTAASLQLSCREESELPQLSQLILQQRPQSCSTLYVAAVEWVAAQQQFLVRVHWDTPFPAEPRAGLFSTEASWSDYCRRLCNQTLAAAYHTLTDSSLTDTDIQAAASAYDDCAAVGSLLDKRKREEEEKDESKKQRQ